MTNDLTGVLTELRLAYRAYQSAKREKKEEIRQKYEFLIAEETREAVEGAKYTFAKLLKDRKEAFDLKVTDIQDHVLRTRNWKMWEELRDYAAITPEQVLRDASREERAKLKAPYRWDDDNYDVLWWQHDRKGKPMDEPIRLEVDNKDRPGSPLVTREHMALVKEHHGNYNDFLRKTATPVIFERFPISKED